ncbi:pentatricopeptide repeat containing protein [Colletotrichum truncatum]|uniref:Pentatricopeptide repeat containing protein n=1 Tax=Colletotrichum truncatum TaxID=5467 RepID=A0ACC3YFY5_COLTU|nr:pentatricopeptide repeat containing protein [Colletotrichum truncatum]KAF6784523.1 pentatricopeptide repeat containing protein [Colletotrichum truncatum]
MLACNSCLKRALKPVISAGSFPEAPRMLQHGLPMRRFQRPYSISMKNTMQELRNSTAERPAAAINERRALRTRQNENAASREPGDAIPSEEEETAPEAGVVSKEHFIEGLKDTVESEEFAAKRAKQKLEWAVGKHLEHMQDRWKIGKHVEATLRKDRFDEALLLTQRASKDEQCVVAWNHLIDYEIRQRKRLNASIKLLNDMKKRGQLPNEQTYTIIFRGCATLADPKAAVDKAVHIYNSLLKDKRLKPNLIHLNAVLQVCGRAGDIDAMFAILETADVKQGRRADAYTYTTILNNLRYKVAPKLDAENPKRESGQTSQKLERAPRELDDAAQQTIDRCKAIWEEVTREWRNGKLKIDENLVCAMGRTLLLGSSKEKAEIFTLVEETMSIPNYTLDTEARLRTKAIPESRGKESKDINKGMQNIIATQTPKQVPGLKNVTYAVPGQNTLSLLLLAARDKTAVRRAKVSADYWKIFTDLYGLKPDSQNYGEILLSHERNGASAASVRIIQQMPPELITPTIIHRGLQTCLRDNMNHAAFDNATAILDLMTLRAQALKEETGRSPQIDLLAPLLYHRVALATDHKFRQMAKAGDEKGAKQGYASQLAAAVNKLWYSFLKAKQAMKGMERSKTTSKPSTVKWTQRRDAFERDLLDLGRSLIATVDRIEKGNMLEDAKELEKLQQRRNVINRFVVELTDPQQRLS